MGKTQPNAQVEKRMTRWVDDQVCTPGLSHDLKHDWCESEGKSKMMLITQWSCNLFEIHS